MTKKLIRAMLALMLLMSLCACGSKTPSPTDVTRTFLNAVKSQDKEALATVYGKDDFDIMNEISGDEESGETNSALTKVYEEEMLPKLLDFDFEISNEQINEDKATVDVNFKTYKLGDAFTSFAGDYISRAFALAFSNTSEKELEAMAASILSEKLSKLESKDYEKKVTISLTKKDDKWMVDQIKDDNTDFLDAISGGLATAISSFDEE